MKSIDNVTIMDGLSESDRINIELAVKKSSSTISRGEYVSDQVIRVDKVLIASLKSRETSIFRKPIILFKLLKLQYQMYLWSTEKAQLRRRIAILEHKEEFFKKHGIY